MTVRIRTAQMGDYPALCGFFQEVDALHRVNHPEIFQKPAGPVREFEYYQTLINVAKIGLFVAEEGEQVVGCVHVIECDAPPIPIFVPRRFAIVDNLVVSKDFQRKGIGSEVLSKVMDISEAKAWTTGTIIWNDANRNFLKKNGFAKIGEIKGDEPYGWYRKTLKEVILPYASTVITPVAISSNICL